MKSVIPMLLALLLSAQAAEGAALDVLKVDGWYTWSVPVIGETSSWCCVSWSRGDSGRGCDLDGQEHGYSDCGGLPLEAGRLRLYARVAAGAVERLMAMSPGCPVRSGSKISDLGELELTETARWVGGLLETHPDADVRQQAASVLARTGADGSEQAIRRAMLADPDRELREEAVFALSQLPGERAVDALLAVVEDSQLDHDLRKTALFWLVQSESERAFASIERLLGQSAQR